MAVNRPQDKTRFRKTYSYARQAPVIRTTDDLRTFSVFTETSEMFSEDVTRMRKTYPSSRQQPVNLERRPPAPPLEIISITPMSGSYNGGTYVVVEVNYTYGMLGATVAGFPLTSFAILDGTHVAGYTQSFSQQLLAEDDVELETEDGQILET